MRFLLIAIVAVFLSAEIRIQNDHSELIPPPYKSQAMQDDARFYTNEGFRASSFGGYKIAKNLFYKACFLGDELGCLALNELNSPLNVESILTNKDECVFGDAKACFSLYKHYKSEDLRDNFKAQWYLSKSCRLGYQKACGVMSDIQPFVLNERQILNQSCLGNDAKACYKLADMYLFGRGVARNAAFAKNLLQKSCGAGLKKACTKYIKILSYR